MRNQPWMAFIELREAETVGPRRYVNVATIAAIEESGLHGSIVTAGGQTFKTYLSTDAVLALIVEVGNAY